MLNNYCKHGYEQASGCRVCQKIDLDMPTVAVINSIKIDGVDYVEFKDVMRMNMKHWAQIKLLEEEVKKGLFK